MWEFLFFGLLVLLNCCVLNCWKISKPTYEKFESSRSDGGDEDKEEEKKKLK